MRVLLDTNVLLRMAEPKHGQHDDAMIAVATLRAAHALVVVPQCLYEYWVVATRPQAVNGRSLSTAAAEADIRKIRLQFTALPDPLTLLDRWLSLVVAHNVRGKPAHDARLAAAMLEHNVTHLLTFNAGDFARFPVVAVDPADVAAGRVAI